MGMLLLYTISLLIASMAVFGIYRLAIERSRGRSSLLYNLGTPCPEGVAAAPCPHCGQLFGLAATEAARQKCERELKSTPASPQGSANLIELIQRIWWNVICPSCGEQSSYVPQARVLLHQGK